MPSPKPLVVRCPRCQGEALFDPSNRWRPFCGERCHTGDFAAWANEEFRVPATAENSDDPKDVALPGDSEPARSRPLSH
ncbi:MAG: DNA gyrase inhibitor YacG [Inhella sp.]|jgi:endogenous inhibitor of DNA gyrase (YacG/DUF329 family)|uniref:DNA gyrase inhibitor YacG n=1 Tax=Inhella sp. TaxID=1921806 RepID=UPI0022C199CC|nr:DNA gyrase inhibitor YacG [Inhella sp.]MCZ8234726.1 DNA gyrase inhibitor YacG [Inhella sp.]